MFTLLGPSGCGKTTLLRLLAGFYTPDAGEIRFGDRVVNEVPAARARHRHGVPELCPVAAHDGDRERRLRTEAAQGRRRRDGRPRTGAVLDKVGLTGLGERYPGQLSGGQQQRVALARALVLNPQMLLLDEPLSNLDAKIRVQVRAEIRKLQKELGITAVYVTHDQEEALAHVGPHRRIQPGECLPDRAAEGALRAACQPLRGRLHRHQQPDRRDGDEQRAGPAGRLRAATALGEIGAIHDGRLRAGDRCVICIRPENIALNGGTGDGQELVSAAGSRSRRISATPCATTSTSVAATLFKADISDPWHHEQLAIGTPITLACTIGEHAGYSRGLRSDGANRHIQSRLAPHPGRRGDRVRPDLGVPAPLRPLPAHAHLLRRVFQRNRAVHPREFSGIFHGPLLPALAVEFPAAGRRHGSDDLRDRHRESPSSSSATSFPAGTSSGISRCCR